MFDIQNIPKKTNLGILRQLDIHATKKHNVNIGESERQKLIKEILEGKFD